jgi:RHH-type rel operon transcriptional repressor/antitoxin RelB
MATTIVLSPEAEERLDYLASETGRSKSLLLPEIIERGLDDVEDYYLSVEVLERIRSGEERVYTSAEIRRDLGLDN